MGQPLRCSSLPSSEHEKAAASAVVLAGCKGHDLPSLQHAAQYDALVADLHCCPDVLVVLDPQPLQQSKRSLQLRAGLLDWIWRTLVHETSILSAQKVPATCEAAPGLQPRERAGTAELQVKCKEEVDGGEPAAHRRAA